MFAMTIFIRLYTIGLARVLMGLVYSHRHLCSESQVAVQIYHRYNHAQVGGKLSHDFIPRLLAIQESLAQDLSKITDEQSNTTWWE